jgi:hypothetical protein
LISGVGQRAITLPADRWVGAAVFEGTLAQSGGAHEAPSGAEIAFVFPSGCKVMADASLLLLSLANQLSAEGRNVALEFQEGVKGTMGYLDRLGFFDKLAAGVRVVPARPLRSGARIHANKSAHVVEIAAISPASRVEPALPGRLVQALITGRGQRPDNEILRNAARHMFSELIDNISEHSQSVLDGFAVLQVYEGGKNVRVAVSDSGLGIIGTLRPVLARQYPQLAELTDVQVIVEAFRAGVSRFGPSRGNGLSGCARKAIDFKAELNVRLMTQNIRLVPTDGEYSAATAYCQDNIPAIRGTHISFIFSAA